MSLSSSQRSEMVDGSFDEIRSSAATAAVTDSSVNFMDDVDELQSFSN